MEWNLWMIKTHLVWHKGSHWNQILAEEYSIFTPLCPAETWISAHDFWKNYFPLNRGFDHLKAS